MDKPDLLWVNLTVSLKEAELPAGFREYFNIRSCADTFDLDRIIVGRPPQLLCFDFDYPDRAGLRLLLDVKSTHPSLPIIMLTLQHSEALAIWAFRSKVWDYLVKPVPRHETDRCLRTLLSAMSYSRNQRRRVPAIQQDGLPDEVSIRQRPADTMLSPAIYYVEKYYRSKFRIEDVAKVCGMSPFRFSRAFKESIGKTFRDYTIDYRLKEACRLLENPGTTVTDVSYAVGFNDPSYFARVFKQRIGMPPSMMIGQTKSRAKRAETESADLELSHIVS
ncbi:MAG: response regulator transcription factor [Gammaproteobacteria bacterium]|nr:MAG: response regulator transcription factor [Gammaproteobacteria bacterium]